MDRVRPLKVLAVAFIMQCWMIFFTMPTHAQSNHLTKLPEIEVQNDFETKKWQLGGFFSGGFAPGYYVSTPAAGNDVELNFYSAGLQVGRLIGGLHGGGFVRGRGEALVEVVPFWKASYPKQLTVVYLTNPQGGSFGSTIGPYERYGATVTPFLLRWNFAQHKDPRILPWAQLGGGLLWTNHKFPLFDESTSVINFTPQAGIGGSLFVRPNKSFDMAAKAVHISSAGLGDSNPGVNVTLQFSVGFSWWK